MQHTFVLRLGYRRLPNADVEPICDPPVDQILTVLWQEASTVVLKMDRFLITVAEGALTIEGRLFPNDLLMRLCLMARSERSYLEQVAMAIRNGYPFADLAEDVVSRARPLLLTQLDQPFVVTESPAFTRENRVVVERPRIEFEDGRLRVVVTGMDENQPMRAWVDGLIRDWMRDAIRERLLRDGGTIDA